jgi:hypothetical protein
VSAWATAYALLQIPDRAHADTSGFGELPLSLPGGLAPVTHEHPEGRHPAAPGRISGSHVAPVSRSLR